MASVAQPEGETSPISLYVALAPDTRGDLEIISRAAIAWAEAIREAAFLSDPFLEVRVELISGTEGSININSLIRAVTGKIKDKKKLRSIAIGIALFFAHDVFDWARGKGYDALWDWAKTHYPEVVGDMTPEERREAEETIERIAQSKSTREKTQIVFRELRKDSVVTGVGVSLHTGQKPRDIVPRSDFAARGGELNIDEETVQRRTERDRIELTLAAPELSGDDNKWKFTLGAKTVWARITDPVFNERLKPGSNNAPHMVRGIRMEVDIETVQELKDNVWVIVDQTITKVHKLSEPIAQPAWLNSPIESRKSG